MRKHYKKPLETEISKIRDQEMHMLNSMLPRMEINKETNNVKNTNYNINKTPSKEINKLPSLRMFKIL
jgi:hypothetical protein